MLSFYLQGRNTVIRDKSGIEYIIEPTDQITSIEVSGCSNPVVFIVPKELIIRHDSPRESWADNTIKGLSLVVELMDEVRRAKAREINELKAQLAMAVKELKELEELHDV